jgi:hypothetical protein
LYEYGAPAGKAHMVSTDPLDRKNRFETPFFLTYGFQMAAHGV